MDHSLRGYLRRQSTSILEMLLDRYEAADPQENDFLLQAIREVLAERKAAGDPSVSVTTGTE